MKKFLIIQTAFIGDVILATPIIEKLHRFYPDAQIDFLLRKGNESLLEGHPNIHQLLIWNKKENKTSNLFRIIKEVKHNKYDYVINLHRHFSSGLITAFSGSKNKIGFDKNPFSLSYTQKIKHTIGDKQNPKHEAERNLDLITTITDNKPAPVKLYPSQYDINHTIIYKHEKYICIAPTSVWFTKQFPVHKWVELIKNTLPIYKVYLLGSASDKNACNEIIKASERGNIENLCGKLTLLQSAALMKDAAMNYVNDSAPLHLASAMNANVTAIFCSTIPVFGFGPLSDNSKIIETKLNLDCRPCGLHGFNSCPKGHFLCAESIEVKEMILLR